MAIPTPPSPSPDRNVCSRGTSDDHSEDQGPAPISLHSLFSSLHSTIASNLQLTEVLQMASAAKWCREAYELQFTGKQFVIRAHPIRNDPARLTITDPVNAASWVAKHGRILVRLLEKMPRLTNLLIEGNERCLREILAHALVLLPDRPRLTDISKLRSVSHVPPMLPLPFHDNAPEGLALLLAEGRLPSLQNLEISRLGSWRFLRDENSRTFLADAIRTGGLRCLTSLSITDDGALLEGLRLAFESRARLQPSTEAKGANLGKEGGNDDDDEQGLGEEIEEGNHPPHRQAMIKKLVVRMKDANYAGIVALLQASFFCRLECLEFGVDHWSDEADKQLAVLATYIRGISGHAPYLRQLSIHLGLKGRTFGPLLPLLMEGHPSGLVHLNLTILGEGGMEELGGIYMAEGLASLTTLHIVCSQHDDEATEAWMEGVSASGHKGAALRDLKVNGCDSDQVLFGLYNGAFPQLESLSICLGDFGMLSEFAQAMGGAPCAQTLCFLDPGWCRCRREEYLAALHSSDRCECCWPNQGVDVAIRCLTNTGTRKDEGTTRE